MVYIICFRQDAHHQNIVNQIVSKVLHTSIYSFYKRVLVQNNANPEETYRNSYHNSENNGNYFT